MTFKSPIISAQELHKHLDSDNLIILDCTIDKVGQSIKDKELILIPKSRFFDLEGKFSDHSSQFPHTLVDEATFTEETKNLGINQDSTIVCYDRWGVYSSREFGGCSKQWDTKKYMF